MDSIIVSGIVGGGVAIIGQIISYIVQKRKIVVDDGSSFRKDLMEERQGLVKEITDLSDKCLELEDKNVELNNKVIEASRKCVECTDKHLQNLSLLNRRIWALENEVTELERTLRLITGKQDE